MSTNTDKKNFEQPGTIPLPPDLRGTFWAAGWSNKPDAERQEIIDYHAWRSAGNTGSISDYRAEKNRAAAAEAVKIAPKKPRPAPRRPQPEPDYELAPLISRARAKCRLTSNRLDIIVPHEWVRGRVTADGRREQLFALKRTPETPCAQLEFIVACALLSLTVHFGDGVTLETSPSEIRLALRDRNTCSRRTRAIHEALDRLSAAGVLESVEFPTTRRIRVTWNRAVLINILTDDAKRHHYQVVDGDKFCARRGQPTRLRMWLQHLTNFAFSARKVSTIADASGSAATTANYRRTLADAVVQECLSAVQLGRGDAAIVPAEVFRELKTACKTVFRAATKRIFEKFGWGSRSHWLLKREALLNLIKHVERLVSPIADQILFPSPEQGELA